MALNIAARLRSSASETDLGEHDRIAAEHYDRDTGRSSFAAFLMGGVVVAGGLLAFLYYSDDTLTGQAGRDVMITGSIAPAPSNAAAMVPSIRLSQSGSDKR